MGLVYPLPSKPTSLDGKEISLESCLGKTVLVIGGGGREHAIVDALSRSPQVSKIYCAPGNAGIGLKAFNVALKDTDVEGGAAGQGPLPPGPRRRGRFLQHRAGKIEKRF